ncbi:recombinase family protein [Synechococcus sp. CS-205]|uniref:recombinase family protein n=1 Tax=Synechococcus sp. CS-205 TaxID=2847984 RepID=UPI00223B4140|nr:recombinase family protein [Synechococcus sp. CS-205]MCT0247466.1 recombinase family protein [Synechococcus sp. CS-205]
MLAVPYSRVSSTEQAFGGVGLARQQASPQAYCEARGWTLWEGHGYADQGISAFGGQNIHSGALGRFLADLKAGQFGGGPVALLIEDVDRFSRAFPLEVLPVLIEDLLNAGVTVSVISRNKDYSRESMRSGQIDLIELLLCLGASHEFSQKLSRRLEHVHEVKRQRVRRGEAVDPGMAPSWLELGPDGQWAFTPYAEVVRRVLKMAEATGFTSIARKLNAEGVPCPGQAMKERWKTNRRGGENGSREPRPASTWNSSSVGQIVGNPAIHGARRVVEPGLQARTRSWREECARLMRQGVPQAQLPRRPVRTYEPDQEDYYPALLSPAEHAALLASIRQRTKLVRGRTDQLHWIGQGLTFCSCGSSMGALQTGKGRSLQGPDRRYLRCHSVHKGLGCSAPMVRLVDAQAHLLTRLSSDSLLEILGSGGTDSKQSELAAAIREQATAQGDIDMVSRALQAGQAALLGEVDSAVVGMLARRQVQLEAQEVEARKRLATADARLQHLQAGPSREQLGLEGRAQIQGLMRTFSLGEDKVEDRRRVHAHLLQLGLRVTVDGIEKRIGLSVGDGPIQWQPLAPKARKLALQTGMVNPERAFDQPLPREGLEQARGRQVVPVVVDVRHSTSKELEAALEGNGLSRMRLGKDAIEVEVEFDLEAKEEAP